MTLTKDKVLGRIEEHREELRLRGVRRLGLFGSAVHDAATEASDLDFVVELEPKSFDAYMEVKIFLEDLFNCRIDLVLASAIKPRLRNAILTETIYAAGF